MTSELIKELGRLGLRRYTTGTDEDAVNLAHQDLLSAPESEHSPLPVCKMYASDVLRKAATLAPSLITEAIIQDCQRVFPDCNDSTCLSIIYVFSTLRRTDTVPFLEQVRDDRTRPNVEQVVKENGRCFFRSYRDDTKPDWLADAATEAIRTISTKGPGPNPV